MKKSRGRTRRRACHGWDAAHALLEDRLLLDGSAWVGPPSPDLGRLADLVTPALVAELSRLTAPSPGSPGTPAGANSTATPAWSDRVEFIAKTLIGRLEAGAGPAGSAPGEGHDPIRMLDIARGIAEAIGVDRAVPPVPLAAPAASLVGGGYSLVGVNSPATLPGLPALPPIAWVDSIGSNSDRLAGLIGELEAAFEANHTDSFTGPLFSSGPSGLSVSGRGDLPHLVRTTLGPGLSGFPVLDGSDSALPTPAAAASAPPVGYPWAFTFDEMPTILPALTAPDLPEAVLVPRPRADEGAAAQPSLAHGATAEPSSPADPAGPAIEQESAQASEPSEPAPPPDPIGVGLRLAAPILDPATWAAAVDHLFEGVDDILGGLDDLGGDDPYVPWVVASALLLTASEVGRRARSRRGLTLATVDGSAVEAPDDRPPRPAGA